MIVQKISQHVGETAAGLSIGSAGVSYASTLPAVQWWAGMIAIVSGIAGLAWLGYQFYHAEKRRRAAEK